MLNLPNALSFVRIPLAVLFPLIGDLGWRFAVVAFAAATDWADGRLARRTGRESRLGEVLDPVADKVFVVTVLITLVAEDRLALWTLPLLLTRDIGVAAGIVALAVRGKRVRVRARRPGKIVTWLQFGAIAAILLWPASAPWVTPPVAVAGLVALRDYARSARRAAGVGGGSGGAAHRG